MNEVLGYRASGGGRHTLFTGGPKWTSARVPTVGCLVPPGLRGERGPSESGIEGGSGTLAACGFRRFRHETLRVDVSLMSTRQHLAEDLDLALGVAFSASQGSLGEAGAAWYKRQVKGTST